MRRGQVPDLLLAVLLDGPGHGYELMDRLERFSGGAVATEPWARSIRYCRRLRTAGWSLAPRPRGVVCSP